MSRRITIKFNYVRNWRGVFANGESAVFGSDLETEYLVTVETVSEDYVNLIMPDGLSMQFYHPGHSTSYSVVREGWETAATVAPTAKPILESALILEIEPTKHHSSVTHTEYLIYKLPRTLNGLLVDRGRINQETVVDRANPEAVGEVHGMASFMLSSRNSNLRYNCLSFRINNKTTKKNLISEHRCASVCASE